MSESRDFARGWLRGFFDGEGCVNMRRVGTGYHYSVAASNTDPSLVAACCMYLSALGISYNLYYKKFKGAKAHWKPIQLIYVKRADGIVKFSRLVGFESAAKKEKLQAIMTWIGRPVSAICRNGHQLSDDNTSEWKDPKTGYSNRKCKLCARQYAARHRAKMAQLRLVK